MPQAISSLQVGIEQITWAEARDLTPLPERSSLTPSEFGIESHLDKLFHYPDRDERLLNALKPSITDRTILLPTRYTTLFTESRELLATAAREYSPSDATTLMAAAQLLESEQLARDLLAHYCGLLIRA